jgi:hypothetical protein
MKHEGRLLYPLQIKPVGEGAVWCAGKRTLLLRLWWDGTTFEQMKKSLPLTPRKGSDELPAPLREALAKRLPRGTLVWMAGQSPPAPLLTAVLPFTSGAKGTPPPLQGIRTFVLGLTFQPDVALIGDLECADAKTASALQTFLEGRQIEGIGAPKVAGTPAGPDTTAHWVSFQLRANPDALREALRTGGKLFPRVGP